MAKSLLPATQYEYAAFLADWQHVGPRRSVEGVDGARDVFSQLQGREFFRTIIERDVLPARVKGYRPWMLDALCNEGAVHWRRLDPAHPSRDMVAFCTGEDNSWVSQDPHRAACPQNDWGKNGRPLPGSRKVGKYLLDSGPASFEEIVTHTGLRWQMVFLSLWRFRQTGEAYCDSFESIRVYEGKARFDVRNPQYVVGPRDMTMSEGRLKWALVTAMFDPSCGRWHATERLGSSRWARPTSCDRAEAWARLLARRYGVVCRRSLLKEIAAPSWREIRAALIRLQHEGQFKAGRFVEGLPGEQFITPKALHALQRAQKRIRSRSAPAKMQLLSASDPANPFGTFFPLVDETGKKTILIKGYTRYLVLSCGRPVLLHHKHNSVWVLASMPATAIRAAIDALKALVDDPPPLAGPQELSVRYWNDHPVDLSEARELLLSSGFVERDRTLVYEGTTRPTRRRTEALRRTYPCVGRDPGPVHYDAAWTASRASPNLRPVLQDLLTFLQAIPCPRCKMTFTGTRCYMEYRGVKCVEPLILKTKIRLQVTTNFGSNAPIDITPRTKIDADEFQDAFFGLFDATLRAIDRMQGGETARG